MVIITVVTHPADNKVTVFLQLNSPVGFTDSRDTIIHTTAEMIAKKAIVTVDIAYPSLTYIY